VRKWVLLVYEMLQIFVEGLMLGAKVKHLSKASLSIVIGGSKTYLRTIGIVKL